VSETLETLPIFYSEKKLNGRGPGSKREDVKKLEISVRAGFS
jgi:hypothetical protein